MSGAIDPTKSGHATSWSTRACAARFGQDTGENVARKDSAHLDVEVLGSPEFSGVWCSVRRFADLAFVAGTNRLGTRYDS
jgi:hypothetical protein